MRTMILCLLLLCACGVPQEPDDDAGEPVVVDAGRRDAGFCFPVVQKVCKSDGDGGFDCVWLSRSCP